VSITRIDGCGQSVCKLALTFPSEASRYEYQPSYSSPSVLAATKVMDDFMPGISGHAFTSTQGSDNITAAIARAAIYEWVLGHCAQFEFDGRWSFITPDEDAYYCPSEPASLLADLLRRFPAAALVEAGVACSAGDATSLRTELLAPDDLLVALRSPAGQPYGFLVDRGCLGIDTVPALACLEDQFTQNAAEETDGQLLVTFSLLDATLFRALGFAAVTATQLDSMTPSMAERLFDAFGVPSAAMANATSETVPAAPPAAPMREHASHSTISLGPAPAADGNSANPRRMHELIFIGWSPATLSLQIPEDLPRVAEYLGKLGQYLDTDWIGAQLWRPSEQELRRFEFFVGHRDARWVQQAFRDSLGASIDGLDSIAPESTAVAAPPACLSETLGELHRMACDVGQHDSYRRKLIWQKLQRQLDQAIIVPLVNDALCASDPLGRNLRLAAAQLSRVFHTTAAAVGESMSMAVAEPGDRQTEAIPAERIGNLLAMSDKILKITQEIVRCEPSSKVKVIEVQSAPVSKPALPRCG
jgi:hypothetical protein